MNRGTAYNPNERGTAMNKRKATVKQLRKAVPLSFKNDLALPYKDYLINNTRAGSNASYINRLIKVFGSYDIEGLTLPVFRTWINGIIREGGLAPSSVKKTVSYMSRIYNYAIERGLPIQTNPFSKTITRQMHKDMKRIAGSNNNNTNVYISPEEFKVFSRVIPRHLGLICTVAYYSGLRRSELAKCKWGNVDLQNKRICFDPGEVKEVDAKVVYYDEEAYRALNELEMQRLVEDYRDDYVFRNESGGRATEHTMSVDIRKHADRFAEISGNRKFYSVTMHTFRRSYRTRKDMEGCDRKAVQANMGHHGDVVSERYNLVDENRQRSVASSAPVEMPGHIKRLIMAAANQAVANGVTLEQFQGVVRHVWSKKFTM